MNYRLSSADRASRDGGRPCRCEGPGCPIEALHRPAFRSFNADAVRLPLELLTPGTRLAGPSWRSTSRRRSARQASRCVDRNRGTLARLSGMSGRRHHDFDGGRECSLRRSTSTNSIGSREFLRDALSALERRGLRRDRAVCGKRDPGSGPCSGRPILDQMGLFMKTAGKNLKSQRSTRRGNRRRFSRFGRSRRQHRRHPVAARRRFWKH